MAAAAPADVFSGRTSAGDDLVEVFVADEVTELLDGVAGDSAGGEGADGGAAGQAEQGSHLSDVIPSVHMASTSDWPPDCSRSTTRCPSSMR